MIKPVSVNKVIEIVDEFKLIFWQDVADKLGVSRPTVYAWFPVESDERKAIENAIQANKIAMKVSMRNKWYKSNNPTLQISLYKMLANKEEQQALSMQYIESKQTSEVKHTVDVSKLPDEVLEHLIAAFRDEGSSPQIPD
jgi:hypothetical protein